MVIKKIHSDELNGDVKLFSTPELLSVGIVGYDDKYVYQIDNNV